MAKKINKSYCNGCIYSRWRAGVAPALSEKVGDTPHSRPEHHCTKLGVKRERSNYKIDRITECVAQGLADYTGAM